VHHETLSRIHHELESVAASLRVRNYFMKFIYGKQKRNVLKQRELELDQRISGLIKRERRVDDEVQARVEAQLGRLESAFEQVYSFRVI
jgi:hypothetical protein